MQGYILTYSRLWRENLWQLCVDINFWFCSAPLPASCKVRWGYFSWYSIQLKKPQHITDAGSSPRCGKGFFSQNQKLPVQTLLRCPYSPCVQSHASASGRTLQIPNTGSHIIVWTHKNTAHAQRNKEWVALLLQLLCLTPYVRWPAFPARDNEVLIPQPPEPAWSTRVQPLAPPQSLTSRCHGKLTLTLATWTSSKSDLSMPW